MRVHDNASRGKYVVGWKADGRRRVQRFESELEAIAFAESVARPTGRPPSPPEHAPDVAARRAEVQLTNRRDGIYSYETRHGTTRQRAQPRWAQTKSQASARRE
jgi:hypothetical protein